MPVIDDHLIQQFVAKLQSCDDPNAAPATQTPRISIVMPSFRQARYLERSLLSILNQNYLNLELIVVDGGSDDGTVDILRKYERYISYWVSEPDAGQSDALNKGFAHATGDIFGWLNSDDIYLPRAFDHVIRAFLEHPSKSIIYGDFLTIDPEDRVITQEYAFDFSLRQFQFEGFHLNAQAMFWRKEVHANFAGFDNRLHNTMDYEMIVAFGVKEGQASFQRIPVPLACFRRHPEQKTKGYLRQRIVDEHLLIARKHGYVSKYTPWGRVLRFCYRGRRAYWYVRRAGLSYAMARFLQRPSGANGG
jgi:glycosyltransferase involved in cell wall biosynthesis